MAAPERRQSRGAEVPATTGTQAPAARQLLRYGAAFQVAGIVLGVRSGLRHPRRLTVLAIAGEAPLAVFCVLRVPRAVQGHRPRIAAGSAPGRSRSGSPAPGRIG